MSRGLLSGDDKISKWIPLIVPIVIVGIFMLVVGSICFCMCKTHYQRHGTISIGSWTHAKGLLNPNKHIKKARKRYKKKHQQNEDAQMPFLEQQAPGPHLPPSDQIPYADGV